MTKDEALKQLMNWYDSGNENREEFEAIVKAALASPVQEPVAIALNTGTKQGVKWLKNVEHGEKLYTTPPAQPEPDLSGLRPATQEAIKGWLADGTFVERAIGAMEVQERENIRLEKLVAEQPAPVQEPVAVHQYRVPLCSDWYDGIPDHHDGHGPYEVRTLYTTPPAAQRQWVSLTDDEIWAFWWNRSEVPDGEDDSMEAQFIAAFRAIEAKLKEKNIA